MAGIVSAATDLPASLEIKPARYRIGVAPSHSNRNPCIGDPADRLVTVFHFRSTASATREIRHAHIRPIADGSKTSCTIRCVVLRSRRQSPQSHALVGSRTYSHEKCA